MKRFLFTLPLICSITNCSEPHQVYNQNASIPENSAVYKLSQQLKRQRENQLPHASDQTQEPLPITSANSQITEHPQMLVNNNPRICNEPAEGGCSSGQTIDRDAVWADPLEGQIREALASVPNVSKANFITVRCGRISCEATGRIYQEIPDFTKEESFAYLEEKIFAENLADANAIPVEVRIVRPSGEFTVIFERVRQ